MIRYWLRLTLLVFCSNLHAAIFPENGVVQLNQAWFIADDGSAPPLTGWKPATLPDIWRVTHPTLTGFAWYRLPFELSSLPQKPLAIYIPHVSITAQLWLNGTLLTPDIHFDEAGRMGTVMNGAPLYIVLPSALFKPGENHLDLRLQGDQRIRSGVSAIRIGPTEILRKQWWPRNFVQVVVPGILLVLFSGGLCFLLSYALRQGRFSMVQLAMVAGVVTVLLYANMDIPISRYDQEALRLVTVTVMYWALGVAGYRHSGAKNRIMPWLLHSIPALILGIGCLLYCLHQVGDLIWFLMLPYIPVLSVVIGTLLRNAWIKKSSFKAWALVLSATLLLASLTHSIVLLGEWLSWDQFRTSTAGGLPFCIVLLFYFAEHFILQHEQAIRDQHAAIATERTRILQDMHDGMGAQLITALRLVHRPDVNREKLAQYIEESLQDLRLIIDSLDLTGNDLLPLLGNLRFRLAPRLAQLGIQLNWDVHATPKLLLSPEMALSILRIVQEAINNVLKHAQATTITVSVVQQDHAIFLRIADNGKGGIVQNAPRGSYGVANMKLRAAKLGAILVLHSDTTGTRISLEIPC